MNYSDLTTTELLHALETAGRLPALDLIRACLQRQSELTPALLDLFRQSIHDDWPDEDDPRWYRAIHAGHLLLAYREEAALPIFEELYRQSHTLLDWFETAPAIYGAAAIPTFRGVLHMDTYGQYHYGRGMSAELLRDMAILYPETRAAVVEALRSLLPPLADGGELDWPHEYPEVIWSPVAGYLATLQDEASRPQIKALLACDWLDRGWIDETSYEARLSGEHPPTRPVEPFDIITTYELLHARAEYQRLQEEATRLNREIDDNVREIVALRQKAGKKISRNEPCPCGSGKKYKKCHGRPGL